MERTWTSMIKERLWKNIEDEQPHMNALVIVETTEGRYERGYWHGDRLYIKVDRMTRTNCPIELIKRWQY